jgi:hypothetical protein
MSLPFEVLGMIACLLLWPGSMFSTCWKLARVGRDELFWESWLKAQTTPRVLEVLGRIDGGGESGESSSDNNDNDSDGDSVAASKAAARRRRLRWLTRWMAPLHPVAVFRQLANLPPPSAARLRDVYRAIRPARDYTLIATTAQETASGFCPMWLSARVSCIAAHDGCVYVGFRWLDDRPPAYSYDGVTRIWRAPGYTHCIYAPVGQEPRTLPVSGPVLSMTFGTDGRLWVCDDSGSLTVYATDGVRRLHLPVEAPASRCSMAALPDGSIAFTCRRLDDDVLPHQRVGLVNEQGLFQWSTHRRFAMQSSGALTAATVGGRPVLALCEEYQRDLVLLSVTGDVLHILCTQQSPRPGRYIGAAGVAYDDLTGVFLLHYEYFVVVMTPEGDAVAQWPLLVTDLLPDLLPSGPSSTDSALVCVAGGRVFCAQGHTTYGEY